MAKVLVTLDERLLRRIDAAARKLRLTRSGFFARLAERELGPLRDPARDARVRRAMADLDRLFARNGTAGEATELIRRVRDERGKELARRAAR